MGMLRKVNFVEFFTTPEELRRLADRLDEMWKSASLGDDVPRATVHYDTENRLDLVIDQEGMYAQERRIDKEQEELRRGKRS